MPLEPKLIHKLTYKLRLTPQVRLSMNLLQLPLLKLKEFIEQQVEQNPLLDVENVQPLKQENYNFDEEKKNYIKSLLTKPATLQEHLLRQLRILTRSDDEQETGELIIGNIDDNGYLRSSVEDIAESAKTRISKVKKVLSLIQTFDPIGVGAQDLRECLLLQLKAKGKEDSLTGQIVDKYLPFLEKKRYKYIAKKLKISIERIKETMKEIARLEPKPGRSFNAQSSTHLIPDAMLRKSKENYEVILNDWELPHLTLNDKYRRMIKQKGTPKDAKVYLQERLKAARGLIEAITRRKETIKRVIEGIALLQKEFLDKGAANFKPMTLEQIAKRIGRHKSTVSRALTNKYLQTPHGLFELRYFLTSGIKQKNGEFLSSKAIKSKIKGLIENENKNNPLTDQKIAALLKQQGISISRRTIAKYRSQLKVLSSKSRR